MLLLKLIKYESRSDNLFLIDIWIVLYRYTVHTIYVYIETRSLKTK